MTRSATQVPLHLSVDPWWDLVTAIAYGRVDDGLPAEQVVVLEEDPRIRITLDAPGSTVAIGFNASAPHEIDVAELDADVLWSGPRFDVPALALTGASIAEILFAVQRRYAPREPTADAIHFHAALGSKRAETEDGARDFETVIEQWRLALEAGDMKALFGLGYTLVEAGRPREAYDALRRYTELTPHNAWAWCWFGRACVEAGEHAEARLAFERAVACELDGSFETDAAEFLDRLT